MSLQKRIADWAIETFGEPESTLVLFNRMCEEVYEAGTDALSEDKITPELVDVLHFMFQIAEREGVDLIEETEKKFSINEERKWNVSESGVGYHVNEDD